MFGALSALVETASARARILTVEGYELVKRTGILDLEKGDSNANGTDSEIQNDTTVETAPAVAAAGDVESQSSVLTHVTKELLIAPPPQWESPAEEWTLLAEAVLMEENSCIIPPKTILEDVSLASKLCGLLNVESIANLPEPPVVGDCEPSQEVVEWLMSSPEKHEFRSSLVPRHVSDEKYWVNLCWRLYLFRLCCNSNQMLDVMEVVSTEPNPLDTTGALRKRNVGVPNTATHWQQLRERLNCRREMTAWLEEQISTVKNELELASSNLQLLTNLISKRETTELGDSVSESCKYHKKKLGRLMGELRLQQKKLVNSIICPDHGSLFAQLVKMNDQLRVKLEAYASLSSKNPSECLEKVPTGVHEEAPLRAETSGGDIEDTTVFEAVLPWEDEETER
ncbi:hypothetical protein TraAM80_07955 [Trypanosoma rangeli]|uniref:Uncharacterized protein n=1 Tax=Trypanosoma rangeli TaxID=5698 RepID=A0A422N306_TRYRA|nr:uncharacterized protein TraAM80_07955 [Trypanosoma rangeli]RNE99830.1 hypothetical protein TraAM80_07955 [Trypanosoma rangeli]|eukprot:RNE99830.1 hypothetical protein TraAM80_07955 [Trypanosoma rangeli]